MNIELVRKLRSDKKFFIENVLQIENKQLQRVPFILKPIQQDMLATMTGRDIYLKPAQVGSTSLHMACFFHDCITRPGVNSVIIAHEEFITQRLLRKVHFWVETTPNEFPQPKHQSSYELTWPELHSSFYIGSARAYIFGRGEPIHNLLASEYAFWPDTGHIMTAALQRVPPEGNIIIESTPNGEDNDFADLYKTSKEMKLIGKSRFTSHFYPWWLEPDYKLPHDSPYALECDRYQGLDLTPDEERLIREYGLTEDHIRWKRMKVNELELLRRNGELAKLFNQEFPEDDISCFLSAADMFYENELLLEKEKECTKPLFIGPDGVKIWVKPEEGKRYIIGIDPGLGKQTRTALTVWNFHIEKNGHEVEVGEHCATLAGMIPPERTAQLAINLGNLYNKALLAPEANSHGLAVISELKKYPNLYKRKDFISGRTSLEIGWLTTSKTKDYMLKEVSKMLPHLHIHDKDITSEMRNVRLAGDKVVTVGLDDLHMSTAIAVVCRESRPMLRGYMGSAGWRW